MSDRGFQSLRQHRPALPGLATLSRPVLRAIGRGLALFVAILVLEPAVHPQHPLQPATGTRDLLVILWDPHRPGNAPQAAQVVHDMIFGAQDSVAGYFAENSRGKLRIAEAGFLGWYDAKYPWQLYWRQPPYSPADAVGTPHEYTDADGNPRYLDDEGFYGGHSHKWAEAVRRADQDFDFSKYDSNGNGDGVIEHNELVILVVIPQAQAFGTRRAVVGSHVPPKPLIVDGVEITEITEAYISNPGDMGVVAHELAHGFVDAPDQYFQCSSGRFGHPFQAGAFSLMDLHWRHPHLDPAQKSMYGWITPSLVDVSGPLVLHDIEETGQVFRLSRPGYGDREYFLLENRWAGNSYDAGPSGRATPIPDQGLAIWHVIEDRELSKNLYDKTGVDMKHLPCVWSDWGRRGIRLIRPVRGSASDREALWDGKDPRTGYDISPFYDPGHPDRVILRWADGVPSGYGIRDLSGAGPSITFTLSVPTRVSLRSTLSQKVVRAGVGPDSHLAAVSDQLRGWERFRAIPLGGTRIALVSEQSGKVVRAGVGPDSHLAAVSDHIAGWETFEVSELSGNKVAFRSTQSGKYVRAGVGPDSHLAAVSDQVKGWETFEWIADTAPPSSLSRAEMQSGTRQIVPPPPPPQAEMQSGTRQIVPPPDEHCERYADQAVALVERARELGCGFSGGRWTDDRTLHRDWCLRQQGATVDGEARAREDELVRCAHRAEGAQATARAPEATARAPEAMPRAPEAMARAPEATARAPEATARAPKKLEMMQGQFSIVGSAAKNCELYAITAVAQERQNRERGCHFVGPGWNPDARSHRTWCERQSSDVLAAETKTRGIDLERCLAGRETAVGKNDRCTTYAATAVLQARLNQRQGCGQAGPRWNTDFLLHYHWCEGQPPAIPDAETAERRHLLTQCGVPVVQ